MRMINKEKLINKIKTEAHYDIEHPSESYVKLLVMIVEAEEEETVRHGKWIECETENGIHFHKCSECGQRDMYQGTFTDWNGRGFSFYYKRQYCPVCGALMDEVEQ